MKIVYALLACLALGCTKTPQPEVPASEPVKAQPVKLELDDSPEEIGVQSDWVDISNGAELIAILNATQQAGQPVLLYLVLPGCEECDYIDNVILKDQRIIEKVNSTFLPIRLDVSNNFWLVCRMRLQKVPAFAAFTKPGEVVNIAQQIKSPDEMLEFLDYVTKPVEQDSEDKVLQEGTGVFAGTN